MYIIPIDFTGPLSARGGNVSGCQIDETCGAAAREEARELEGALDGATAPGEYTCPMCGSLETVSLVRLHRGTRMSGCFACRALWETIPDGETHRRDGELMPWRKPCDNCAFRAGSPESQNRVKWRELLARLKAGGQFFCHKGVPIEQATIAEGLIEFDYPKGADGKEDPERMRVCRGFLNAWAVWEGIR
jgi:hypothetical protein